MTAYARPLARTAIPATYRTDTIDPTVFFTALTEDGTILVDRTSVGVTLSATGLYEYIVPVDATIDTFIARWDEDDGDPAIQYDEELIVVPRGDKGATGATGAAGATGASGGVASVAGKTGIVTLVEGDITSLVADLAAKAPTASPTFTGTPVLPAGTIATTQAAHDNSTKIATTAYADAAAGGGGGGGGGVPSGASYTITTNGTTMTAYNSTGTVVATGTDLGVLVNGLIADFTSFQFGTGVFPWSTAITVGTHFGVTLRGQGGRQNENKGAVGGRSTTQFKWTPTSGQAFSAVGSQGLTLDSIGFEWTSSSYTSGDGTKDGIAFMSIEGIDHSTPTRHCLIQNCYLGAVSSGKLDTGGPVLDVNKTVNIAVRDSLFNGGTMNVRSHHTNTTDDFANVVEFTGCRFARHKAPTIAAAGWPSFYGSGISWVFRNCHWEPSQGGPQYVHETNIEKFYGLTYADCWVGDQSGTPPAAAAMITFHGSGLTISGGQWDLQDGYSLIKTNAATSGVLLSSIYIPNISSSASGFINCTANGITDFTIQGLSVYPTTIVNGGLTQPARITGLPPYKALSANTTLNHVDHDRVFGVNATAGAITITLPAVACVGCRISVKKTDASANAVTVTRASSALIDGAITYVLSARYDYVTLISDGSNWNVVAAVVNAGAGGGFGI